MTDSSTRPLLTIVSNADARFLPGLEMAVSSTTAAASGKYDYRFLILDGGLPPESLDELRKVIERIASLKGIAVTIDLLTIDQSRLMTLPERRGSRMTYAKLVLPEQLPHLDEIIYLDADVLCFKGVESVHPPQGETHWLLAGARDYFSVIEKDCPWIDQVPPEERKLPYINCGVMWMNLKGLREVDFTARSIAARAAAGQARQGDQSVFNFLCRGRSYILPNSINHRTTIGATRPLCQGNLNLNLHYIGTSKPWLEAPKTSNWLAHCLWHEAHHIFFPYRQTCKPALPTCDQAIIRKKSWFYTLLNPKRAKCYRSDLLSLKDPEHIISQVDKYWKIN
ncbi:MAG: glycosyltransferase [Luteolibacter sp.]